jgi:hypothetical protein
VYIKKRASRKIDWRALFLVWCKISKMPSPIIQIDTKLVEMFEEKVLIREGLFALSQKWLCINFHLTEGPARASLFVAIKVRDSLGNALDEPELTFKLALGHHALTSVDAPVDAVYSGDDISITVGKLREYNFRGFTLPGLSASINTGAVETMPTQHYRLLRNMPHSRLSPDGTILVTTELDNEQFVEVTARIAGELARVARSDDSAE